MQLARIYLQRLGPLRSKNTPERIAGGAPHNMQVKRGIAIITIGRAAIAKRRRFGECVAIGGSIGASELHSDRQEMARVLPIFSVVAEGTICHIQRACEKKFVVSLLLCFAAVLYSYLYLNREIITETGCIIPLFTYLISA